MPIYLTNDELAERLRKDTERKEAARREAIIQAAIWQLLADLRRES